MIKKRWRIFIAFALVLLGVGIAMGVAEKDFSVRSFSPKGTVEGRVQVRAVFSGEVVSGDDVGRVLDVAEMPFIFTPQIQGEGKWSDAKTFVFTPGGGLLSPATKYTAMVNPWLRDLSGRKLSGAKSFVFNTAPLKFIGVTQTNFELDARRVYYELEFSMPVSPSRLAGYLSLTGRGGEALNYSLRQGQRPDRVIMTTQYFNSVAELTIAKDFPPLNGTLGLEKTVKARLSPTLGMTVLDASVQSGVRTSSIIIQTNATVDFARASSFVELSPAVKYSIDPHSRGFAITGDFKPQDRVKVTIKKGFPSLEGPVLENEWTRAFIFPDKEPRVKLDTAGRVITPKGSLRVPVETVNIDKISVEVWKLYENNISVAMRNEWEYFPTELSKVVFSGNYATAGKPNETARRALDLRQAISGDQGVFLVTARNADGWEEDRAVLNVTDLGVTAKVGPASVFAWITSIRTGEPVYGAKVTFWSAANQPVAEAMTDIRGIAAAELADGGESSRPVLATVTKGGDTSFVRLGNGLYGGRDEIDTTGRAWHYRGYSAFCYMPRDIFRPGETVPFRAIVRDINNAAPKPFPLTVRFFAPTGKQWSEYTAKLTDEGAFAADAEFAADVQVGVWQARLYAPGEEEPVGYKEFWIEEFAAPRLFVEASADKPHLVGADGAKLKISSRHAFGAAASGLQWEAQQTAQAKEFRPDGWKGYSFHDAEAAESFKPESDLIGSGKLDAAGEAEAAITSRAWPVPSMARVSARAGVMEDGGRWVYKTVTLDWYPREVMAGISMPGEISQGKKFEFSAAAVGIDGKAADVKKLEYKIFRKVTQSVRYEEGGRQLSRVQTELLERAKGEISLKGGKGTASFTPEQPGQYLLRVEDPHSGARASSSFIAYQPYSDGDEEKSSDTNLPDRVELTMEKSQYKPGETVRVRVKAPFAGQLLLSVETYKQVHRVAKSTGGKEEVEIAFRANEFMLPNAWITAQVVRPSDGVERGGQQRAYGAAPLMMDNSAAKYTVEIGDIGVVEPGPLDVSLTVKDSRGNGAAAEVTLMLVDETVLGLTGWQRPDPWGYFTDRRALGMETYDLYNAILSPENDDTPLLTPGGDGYDEMAAAGKSSLNPVKAQRFKILSLTKTVTTASNGKATVRLDVPEFAGAARLTAVAVSAKAMGSGETSAQINRDIVLEPSLPRALAPKDRFTAPLTVFNMSGKDTETEITIKTTGPIKLDGASAFPVKVKAGQSASRELAFTGTGYGVAKVAFTAVWKGGKIEDVIELPVRPAAPRVSENMAALIEPDKSHKINLAGDWFPGTRSGRVMLSAMPQISVANVAQFLITYPYGCLEQTVSSAWPVLVMPELVSAVDPELATKESLSGSLKLRLQRIAGLQNFDGGFSRWPGMGWSHAWDSMYAAHLLLEAKKRGEEIPPRNLDPALNYVRRQLSAAPPNDSAQAWSETLTRRAYACYVLALAGEKQLGWMSSLLDRQKELTPAARLLLAAAYGEAGEKKTAASLLGKTLETIKPQPGGNDVYDSDLRNKALSLLARTHVDPASAEAASAAYALLNSFKAARYYSTQEGGFAVLALARYFSAQPAEGKPEGVIKDAAGKTVAELNEKTRIISADAGAGSGFTMENKGKARLFTVSTVGGVPTKPVAPVDSGITLRQTLRDRDGKTITASAPRGEALTATVEITPTAGTLRNVVVAIPLPAGLEVENPRLTGGEGELPYNARVELRDDRVLLFIDIISKSMTWRYSVRPVTAGKFTVPQISAECMYDPAVQSISGGGTLEIRNAE